MAQPFNASASDTYYIIETVAGETPANPAWTPYRNLGGIPAITKDSLISAELDSSREVKSIRTGNESITGDFSIEFSHGSYWDMLANAMSSDWVAGGAFAGVDIIVDDVAKTFTRATGDFIADGVKVGDLVQFTDLTGGNAKAFTVTAVTALVLTGSAITRKLTAETATTDYKTGAKLGTGNLCKTMSVLTVLRGKCGTVTKYVLTKGVEMTGWTLEIGVNAMLTGSFPIIGLTQTVEDTEPTGSTYIAGSTSRPYASLDGKLVFNGEVQGGFTSLTVANDNGATPQFEIGSKSVAFVERGTANNTVSGSLFMFDTAILDKFINEEIVSISMILNHIDGGAMSITLPQTSLTAVTPDLSSASVTQAVEGQGVGDIDNSSIVIQYID